MRSIIDAVLSKNAANDLFRHGVAPLDPCHEFGALRLRESVRHVSQLP